MLRVLMISSDRKILESGSAVGKRMIEYGNLVDELHIVLFSDRKHGFKYADLSPKVKVYPTHSVAKLLRPLDAVKIGRNIKADVITAQDPFFCGWAGAKLSKIHKIPLEIQIHTDLAAQGFLRRQVARRVLKVADSIRVVAKFIADGLGEYSGKANVLPIYIDRTRISGETKFDLHNKYGFEKVILTVCRLAPEKNLGLAMEAVSKVSGAGLIVVGDGPEKNKYEKSENVVFVGWQEDLASYYKTADVYIQTSKFEGYGLSVVEAGLSALPVISTPVGIVRDLENVAVAETAKQFSEKISELCSDLQKRKNLGINLQKELEAEVYTKEAYLRKLGENWQRLAQKKI